MLNLISERRYYTMDKKKLIPIIAGAAVVVAVIIAIISLANPAKSAMSKYNKAFLDEDTAKLYEFMPQLLQDARNEGIEDDDDKLDSEDFIKEIKDELDEQTDDLEKDFNRKFTVLKATKVKKDIVEQYNEYLDKYSQYKDVYDKSKHEVTAAYLVELRWKTTNDEKTHTSLEEVIFVKENGEWKLLDSDFWYTSTSYFDWENENDFKELEEELKKYEDEYGYEYY